MTNRTYPGVYVEEVSSGVRPIQAASTSTPAFIGIAQKGSFSEAVKIFNFTEYQNLYGDFLNNSFLAHSVYQFFNNGGSQCYIIRVVGANPGTANIILKDRDTKEKAQKSLTVAARFAGIWGNDLALVITDGTNDPANEFNLLVYRQSDQALLERFENLSMVPSAFNFVERVTAASKFIRVTTNRDNTNAWRGTSRGASAPRSLEGTGRTVFRININGDGYQEVNLRDAVGSDKDKGQVTDLRVENLAAAIQYVVRQKRRQRDSTAAEAFPNFECILLDDGALLLTSGVASSTSAVTVAPASNEAEDATGFLRLGKLRGGIETFGWAVRRPLEKTGNPPASYLLVGDNVAPTDEVVSVDPGSDGDLIMNDQPYINAFKLLDNIDDVSLIAVPGVGSSALVSAGLNYCANRSLSDCFFVGDMSQDADMVSEAETFVNDITTKNSYGAVYFPWIKMLDPTGASPDPILVPPSGYVAGLYAKTDAQRGVWKAPAGTGVALGGATGLAANLTDVQQGILNNQNVNCIRQFAASGIVLWGAKTISSDLEYGYIPVRRMAIFLRVSIYRGLQWAVFEPNDEPLWRQIRLNIRSFMTTLFRQGAFQGSTPSQAFFVKCDGETTTQDDINLGRVNVLVGFAPLKPAEFVIVRISQMAGQTA